MTLEIKDLAGLSTPITKLIEVVSAGMGKAYEPTAIRKKADADGYAIRVKANADAEAEKIRAEAEATALAKQIEILANGDSELMHRARVRVLSREVEGQVNIEKIVEHAFKLLPNTVSDKPVDADWRRKFFADSENICDADLQFLWGKILAGETSSPGSYSLRTLDVLKNLSKDEAEMFRRFCNLTIDEGTVINLGSPKMDEFGLPYNVLMTLRDAGLVHENDNLQRIFKDLPTAIETLPMSYNGIMLGLQHPHFQTMQLNVLVLTGAGRQLRNLIDNAPNDAYLRELALFLRAHGFGVKRARHTPVDGQPGVTTTTFDEDF